MMSNLTTARWHLANRSAMPWNAEVSAALLELLNDRLGYAPPGTPEMPIAPLPPIGADGRIALCLGHARAGDEGNVGAGGESEEDFNGPLIRELGSVLRSRGISIVEVHSYTGSSYAAAMRWLAGHLRDLGCIAAVEFHFNAYNKQAAGHEVLHWKRSTRGVSLARHILHALDTAFPQHPSRGLKPKDASDRGALFLSLTHCPAAIVEPFFGDNPVEWRRFREHENYTRLVHAYADGIESFLTSLQKGQAA